MHLIMTCYILQSIHLSLVGLTMQILQLLIKNYLMLLLFLLFIRVLFGPMEILYADLHNLVLPHLAKIIKVKLLLQKLLLQI